MTMNPFEDEIDAIRIKHYGQTKNMTPDERIAYIKGQIAPTLEKYNIRVVSSVEELGGEIPACQTDNPFV
jgi:hypothetical protein